MKNIFKYILVFYSLLIFISASVVAQSGTTQYVYDKNGRLTAVISPNGETAVYEYDAAGNVLSITKQNQPIVSLVGLVSSRELVGSQVMIQGTGFIPNVSQNQVRFNGASAVIISATINELKVIVPGNATTGKITVSNINGSAESFQDFVPLRLITPNDPPQSLNFDAVNKNYVFRFSGLSGKNISLLLDQVISSGFQINVSSPTGRLLTLNTYNDPTGNKIFADKTLLAETGDYEIELTSSNVENVNLSLFQFDDVAGDIPTDESPVNVAIMYPGQNATLNLNVSNINQPTFLNVTGSAITSFYIILRSPTTGAIIKAYFSETPNKTIKLENLPFAGLYKVEFNPQSYLVGSATINYSLNPLNSIDIDGPPLSLTLPANQSSQITFAGNAGQRVFIRLNTGYFQSVNVQITKPDGEILDEGATSLYNSAIDISDLPETGIYRIVIDAMSNTGADITISAASTGTVGGDCYDDSNICFSKEVFTGAGQSVDLNLEVVDLSGNGSGSGPSFAFIKTQHKSNGSNSLAPIDVEFIMSEVNITGEVTIFDSDNNLVNSFSIDSTSEVVTFSGPGSYRIRIVPAQGQSGSFKLNIRNLSQPPPNS